jgi:hypothetical protein
MVREGDLRKMDNLCTSKLTMVNQGNLRLT